VLDDVPDLFGQYVAVVVDREVAESRHALPADPGVFPPGRGTDAPCCLANDFQIPDYRVLNYLGLEELAPPVNHGPLNSVDSL
jgi:hypothetical protein